MSFLDRSAVVSPALALHFLLEVVFCRLSAQALLAGAESHEGGEVPAVGGDEARQSLVLIFPHDESPLAESLSVMPECKQQVNNIVLLFLLL